MDQKNNVFVSMFLFYCDEMNTSNVRHLFASSLFTYAMRPKLMYLIDCGLCI